MPQVRPQVRIFSTPACAYCETLKLFFKEHNIQFEEIDVSKDEAAKKEMIEKSGQMGVPVVDIDGEFVVGFDKEKVSDLLGLSDQ